MVKRAPEGLHQRGYITALAGPHGSHAIDRGASLPKCSRRWTIATTSGYLHARPNTSSGRTWIPECFFDEEPGKGGRRLYDP